METKIEQNYRYSGLGIEIILKEVELCKIGKDWLPNVDVEELAHKFFPLLPFKTSRYTGDEIAFIRTYLKMSKSKFGKALRVSHTAVNKWEKAGKEVCPMEFGLELFLRLLIAEKLEMKMGKYKEIYLITQKTNQKIEKDPLII